MSSLVRIRLPPPFVSKFNLMSILVTGEPDSLVLTLIVELLNQGHGVVAFDNLSNSKSLLLSVYKSIAGKGFDFIEGVIFEMQNS